MSVVCDICGQEFKDTRGLAGHRQFKHAEEREERTESRAVTRALPLDGVIENLRLPQVPDRFNGNYNIYVAGFNDGVMHGARSILAGIRAAQELSSMGIAQAKPLISMAQEMRQVEGQAAQELASQLGQAILQGNSQVISAIHSMAAAAQKEPAGPNPMASMMANTMAPFFQQIMGNLMTTFMRPQGSGSGSPQPGQPPHTEHPLQYQKDETGGFEGADEEDVRRAFDE